MNKKTRHHYLPKSYQKLFSSQDTSSGNKKIFVKRKQKSNIDSTIPGSQFCENHYHTSFGSLDIENFLGEEVEGRFKQIANKIEERERLEDEEKEVFSFFVALMLTRPKTKKESTREFFEEVVQKSKTDSRSNKISRNTPSSGNPISVEEIEEGLKDFNSFYNQSMISNAYEHAFILLSMDWNFFFCPKNINFICSDAPLSMCAPEKEEKFGSKAIGSRSGLLHKDIEITFPISADCALLAVHDKGEQQSVSFESASKQAVDELNWRTARGADALIANEKSLLKQMQNKFDPNRSTKKLTSLG